MSSPGVLITGSYQDPQEECNEQTSLLSGSQASSPTLNESQTLSPSNMPLENPLPWRAVSIILILNGLQPLAFELVFPFINQMILETGIVTDPERVGFYSGTIESLFAVMSFIFVLPCSSISDRYGRKPVVLISIFVLAISTALFGFSKSFWFMIMTRAIGGIASASWSTMKVMLGEITDKTNQGRAIAAFGIAFKLGQILGQPVGGLMSHPERYSNMFNNRFWNTYPYALPCLFSGSIAFLGATAGIFLLQETKPNRKRESDTVSEYGSTYSEEQISAKSKSSNSWLSILTPEVSSLMFSTFAMTLVSETLFALYPLFAFTPVEYGGLGLDEGGIGAHMAARSIFCIFLIAAFAPMQRHIGTLKTYELSMQAWPLCCLFFPLLNLLKRWEVSALVMNSALAVFFTIWGFAHNAWSASTLMINDAAPSAESLAAINGLAQMVIVLPEAISPAFVNSLFAWTISNDVLQGYLTYVVLFGLCFMAAVHSTTLKEVTHDWRENSKYQDSR
ncbi:MFS general substrate transporter [Pyrrhoderma noxium]|uniref:MFS general substrate transporter n=1 Tax=Pyrrhoderma noxium TaxID=2282107 RepID=A0A286UK08_9AGAM|nr:MFS general substrate transporter [Pyrrhoderma noxium]